jgi:hypothetical protein
MERAKEDETVGEVRNFLGKRSNNDFDRSLLDLYESPPEVVDYLIYGIPNITSFNNKVIFEPCCGKRLSLANAMYEHGFKNVKCSDILVREELFNPHDFEVSEKDFLSGELPYCDLIITNPPFAMKEEFIERCFKSSIPFALLLPVDIFGTLYFKKLCSKYVNYNNTLFIPIAPKVSFMKEGKLVQVGNVFWLVGNYPCDEDNDHCIRFKFVDIPGKKKEKSKLFAEDNAWIKKDC